MTSNNYDSWSKKTNNFRCNIINFYLLRLILWLYVYVGNTYRFSEVWSWFIWEGYSIDSAWWAGSMVFIYWFVILICQVVFSLFYDVSSCICFFRKQRGSTEDFYFWAILHDFYCWGFAAWWLLCFCFLSGLA